MPELTPLTRELSEIALDLLDEGFPERGRSFWQGALGKLLDWPGNAEAGYPVGFLWFDAGAPAGVVLTPASLRQAASGGRRTIVNVSSWYVRPDFRWKAPLMLRSLFRDESVVFTDLTAAPGVQQMLAPFGLHPVNQGIALIPTPTLLAGRSRAEVRAWRPEDLAGRDAPDAALIDLHRRWGCRALTIDDGRERHLLVLKPFRYRGLPAAQALYVGSHRALDAALPAVARHMLLRGCLVLQVDRRPGSVPVPGLRQRGIWFAKGGCFRDRTDHLGSELSLFGI
jgi:hypothetical protein